MKTLRTSRLLVHQLGPGARAPKARKLSRNPDAKPPLLLLRSNLAKAPRSERRQRRLFDRPRLCSTATSSHSRRRRVLPISQLSQKRTKKMLCRNSLPVYLPSFFRPPEETVLLCCRPPGTLMVMVRNSRVQDASNFAGHGATVLMRSVLRNLWLSLTDFVPPGSVKAHGGMWRVKVSNVPIRTAYETLLTSYPPF
jgi:hypothetical protein